MIQSLYEPFKKWSENGAVYIISDTHFGDPDCQIMNPNWPDPECAVRVINSVVTKNDTLVILGDVGDEHFVSSINAGYKVLVCGNHDKGASRYMNGLFDEVYTGPLVIGEKLLLSHEPIYLPFVTNIHGHVHGAPMRYKNVFGCNCLNLASDVCGFKPINLWVEIKNGLLSDTQSIHRLTIDKRI